MATSHLTQMCPHCGYLLGAVLDLTTVHAVDGDPGKGVCPGSQQIPRCAESDGRPLWNGKPNPHFYRNREA